MPTRRTPIVMAAALLLVLVGCGSQSAPGADTPGRKATAPAAPRSTPVAPGSTIPADTTPSDEPDSGRYVFDSTSGDYLYVEPAGSDRVHVRLGVRHVGLVWTGAAATVTPSPQGVMVRYDGPAYIDRHAKLMRELPDPFTLPTHAAPTRLRLVALLDPTRTRGSVEVWVDGTHTRFTSRAPVRDASATAHSVMAALRTSDWHTLYTLSDSTWHELTEARFAARFEKSPPTDVGIRQTGPITYRTVGGVDYAQVPVFERVTFHGRTDAGRQTLVLTYQNGAWLFDTSESPQGSGG